MSSDTKKFLGLRKIFRKCGYGIVKAYDAFGATFGYKIFYLSHKNIKGFNYSFPFIDIFLYKKMGGKWKPSEKDARDIWPAEWFTDDELFPLKKYKFGSFQIYGPNKYDEYFNRLYGKDWNIVAYRQYDHSKEEEVKKVKVKLSQKDRVPAQPTRVVRKSCITSNIKIPSLTQDIKSKHNLQPYSIQWRWSYIFPELDKKDRDELENTVEMLLSPVRDILNLSSKDEQKKIDNFLSKHEVIVSLTTSPLRLNKLVAVLSTLDYTHITKVNIVLPEKYGPKQERYDEMPENLVQFMEEVPQVKILQVKKDLGPMTKMLPSITKSRDKKSLIISVDDDVAYPMGMINELIYQRIVKHPNTVLTMGESMPFFEEVGNMNRYWPEKRNKRPFVDIVEGWSSILYSPDLVNTTCMKKLASLSKQCFLSDDFVISYALAISNKKRLSITNKYADDPIPYAYGAGEDALHAGRGLGEKREYEKHSDAINFEKYTDCLKTIANYVYQVKHSKKGTDPCGLRERSVVTEKCDKGYILNPDTRRCVSRTGSIGNNIIKDKTIQQSHKSKHRKSKRRKSKRRRSKRSNSK
jgi:hypothetical protein